MTTKPTHEDILRLLGPLDDHTVVAIMALDPQLGALEAVSLRLAQEDDVLGDERVPLSGTAALIYDLVMRDPANAPLDA